VCLDTEPILYILEFFDFSIVRRYRIELAGLHYLEIGIAQGAHFIGVKALEFDFRRDAQAPDLIEEFKPQERNSESVNKKRRYDDELRHELLPVTKEQPGYFTGDSVYSLAVCTVREKSRRYNAPNAVAEMNGYCADRVVDLKFVFYLSARRRRREVRRRARL
jgi:hypothetical protein